MTDYLTSSPMFVSVHIPKTGGTTFGDILLRLFGDGFVKDNGDKPPRMRLDPQWLPMGLQAIPPRARCIHGHFLASKYLGRITDAILCTWFRDPIERAVSNYQHFARESDAQNPFRRMIEGSNLDVGAFCAIPAMRNLQAYWLAGVPLERFQFIGITEQFDRSLKLFQAILDVSVLSGAGILNANPARTGTTYAISDKHRAQIEEANLLDRELVLRAHDRFEQLCRHYGV